MIDTTNKMELSVWFALLLDSQYLGFNEVYMNGGDMESLTTEKPENLDEWEAFTVQDIMEKIMELTPEHERLFSLVEGVKELSEIMAYLIEDGIPAGPGPEVNVYTLSEEELEHVMNLEGNHVCGHCSNGCTECDCDD